MVLTFPWSLGGNINKDTQPNMIISCCCSVPGGWFVFTAPSPQRRVGAGQQTLVHLIRLMSSPQLAVAQHSSQVGRGVDCVNYNKCKQSRQADKDSGQSGQAALQRPLHSLFHDITLSIFHPLSTKCAVFNIQPAVYPATQTIYSISKLDNEIFNSESFDSLTDYLPNTKLEERDEERTLNIIATNTAGVLG